MVSLDLFNEILVDSTITVIVQVAVLPLFVFTVIVAVPAFFAVTKPLVFTVAMLVSLLVHVTLLFVALLGLIFAESWIVAPTFNVSLVLFKETPITGTTTVTVQVAVLPLFVFTVIVAVPAFLAVTKPLLTVATLESLVVHVTLLFVALLGVIVAVS